MDLLGGGKFFPWGGNCPPPPRYIVKKGTGVNREGFGVGNRSREDRRKK